MTGACTGTGAGVISGGGCAVAVAAPPARAKPVTAKQLRRSNIGGSSENCAVCLERKGRPEVVISAVQETSRTATDAVTPAITSR
jgi:hypothetical protein